MDSQGSNFAKYQVEALHTKDSDIDARLRAVEDQARKIDVMKEKIDRLEGGLKR
jgi:hypothetical protein